MKEKFACWSTLFVHYLKRDWKKILSWILGVGIFAGGFLPYFEDIAAGEGIIGIFETLQNPAMTSMIGPTPVESAADYSLGALYVHEMTLFTGIFATIVSVLHVIGHTRKEEDLGLTELLRSYRIGRQANSLASLVETVLINLIIAVFIIIMMLSFDLDSITFEGTILYALSIATAGILGATFSLLIAQIMPNSSGATGTTLTVFGLFYILRAATDVSNVEFSMFNPMGWTYLTYPYTENNWLPIIYASILSLLLSIIAFALEEHRDMGSGFLPEREGRERAKRSLLSVPGLYFKQTKGNMIAWTLGIALMGAAFGSIYGDMQNFINSNELIQQMFLSSDASLEESFTGTIMVILVSMAAIPAIVTVNKLFADEKQALLSQLYATRVTRFKLYWTTISLSILSAILGVFFASGSLALAAISTMDSATAGMDFSTFLAAGFNLLPSLLFYIGLAALALGWLPRIGKVIYAYFGYSFILHYFSGLLDLPEWLFNTSIQNVMPHMPIDNFDLTIFITVTAASIGLILIGYIGYKRRDMTEGA